MNIQQPTLNIERPVVLETCRFLLLLAILLLCGCKSTICMESTKRLHHFDGGLQPVCVTNPEMHPEYEILKTSAIYQLTNKPDNARKLTLLRIQHYPTCANPLMGSFLTLGILPGYLPGGRVFAYDLEMDGQIVRYVHPLPVYERFSIWEWLVFRNEQQTLAKALAWSSRVERRNNMVF